MFSMLRGLSAIRVNVEDVSIPNFHQPIVTDVNISLETTEDRLTDVMRLYVIREETFDRCIPTDYPYLELLYRRMKETNCNFHSLLQSVFEKRGKTTLGDFQSLCACLDIYRGSEKCTGWSSKTFRSELNVSDNG